MSVGALLPVSAGLATAGSSPSGTGAQSSFLDLATAALKDVSGAQAQASTAEASYAAGVPGATLAHALVASDRAETAWSATVAVRNEAVSAYQSIMNMQF
ncbi:MAG TPA: flagellar hook-basal body complex protein FliE [Acidocella sp.]|nr:flagellar hook-basal body complex protein FliE [Acidocella sp.]